MNDEINSTADALEASAIPRAHVVHMDPDAPKTPEQKPLPKSITRDTGKPKSPAQWAYERLALYIQNFEEQLDAEHEVAMGFVGGGPGVMRIEGIGYFDPDILTFYGSDDSGARTQLVQHVGQLNVLLRALPKAPQHASAQRIGFRLAQDRDAP